MILPRSVAAGVRSADALARDAAVRIRRFAVNIWRQLAASDAHASACILRRYLRSRSEATPAERYAVAARVQAQPR